VAFFPQVDTIAPAQYFRHCGNGLLGPEKRLMLAVLEDAIECFQRYAGARDGKRERLFLEAEKWILTRDSNRPFSFENICDVLGLDPNYIRRGLLRKHQLLSSEIKKKCRFISKTSGPLPSLEVNIRESELKTS
jgi:hypothetical protein